MYALSFILIYVLINVVLYYPLYKQMASIIGFISKEAAPIVGNFDVLAIWQYSPYTSYTVCVNYTISQ